MPRPRGGDLLDEEIAALKRAGVDCVVCLLESGEVRELQLTDEAQACAREGVAFHAFPIPDRGTPASLHKLRLLLGELHAQMAQGQAVAVHCRAGIGRSGLVAACLLHGLGVPRDELYPRLSRARGVTVPDTPEQVAWLRHYIAQSVAWSPM